MPVSHLAFSERLIRWQQQHGRHHLPWQVSAPYAVWLSEIMLQQTQVTTVLDYYPRFLQRFPTVEALAAAPQDEVLSLWAGLGYYSRARNLHKAAQQVITHFNGRFPSQRSELESLCGVGRSTAAAIAAFAFQQREAILDGNVKRVLCRVFARDGVPGNKAFEQSLWDLAESLLPTNAADMPAYTQGLMDLGATVCKRNQPLCARCPMASICEAKQHNRIHELPRKKTTTEVQTLPMYWLILRDRDNQLWLEKRPQHGIWGGLYCVPCFNSLAELETYALTQGLEAQDLQEAAPLTHRLTHRLLLITPLCASINTRPIEQHNSGGLWISSSKLAEYGLPKPLESWLHSKQPQLL